MSVTTDRITEIEDIDLPGARAAISSLVTGKHSEYWLDSGQTNQRVKRLDLKELRDYENDLNKELQRLRNSIGSSAIIAVPSRTW